MAGFCGNCGAPIRGPFCGKCGQPAEAPAAAAPPSVAPVTPASVPVALSAPVAVPAPLPPAKSGGGLGKVLLVLAVIFGVLVIAGAGAVWYGVHWAKNKVRTYSAAVTGGANPNQVVVAHGDTCRLLAKEDLQQILGVAIEKTEEITEGDTPGCAYFTNTDGFTQLRKMAMEEARRDSERASKKPAPKTDNPLELLKNTKDLEGTIKTLGMQQPAKDGQVFSFTVDRTSGSEAWTTMRGEMAVLPGFEEVQGVGDHAMVGTFGHVFMALKGNTIVALNTLYVPEAGKRGAEIARRILSRM